MSIEILNSTVAEEHKPASSDDEEKKLYWREYHRIYSKDRYNKNPIVRMKKKIAYYKRAYVGDDEIQSIISSDRDIINKIIDLTNVISMRRFK